jgi:hypothetical protein
MVNNTSMDWRSIAGIVSVLGHIVKPQLKYVGITHSYPFLPTSPSLSMFHRFLLCAARFKVAWPFHSLTRYLRHTAKNSTGWVGIYDDQDGQVYGSQSVWVPNDVAQRWNNVPIIGSDALLPISMNVVVEGTLLLFLVYPSDIKSSNDPALIILRPNDPTWQLTPFSSLCFNYNGYSGTPICNVAGSLWPNYKVRFRVESDDAYGAEKELTLSELLNSCINSVQ